MTGRTALVTIPDPASSHAVVVASSCASQLESQVAIRDVSVRLWRVRAHLDGRRAKYVLRVENRAAIALHATTFAFSTGRSRETGAAMSVAVPGRGSIEMTFLLDLPRARPARAVTEIRVASETFVFAESASPRSPAGRIFLAALAFVAVAAFEGSGLMRPGVTALAAPGDVRASRPFSVAYALSRATAAGYRVRSADGMETAHGTLGAEEGSFDVALPRTTSPRAYDIDVTAQSRFGETVRSVRVLAEPDPAPRVIAARPAVRRPARVGPPFRIERLGLGSDMVAGGKPVVAYYRVSSVDGTVRLIDQYGTVRAEALLNRRGNSILLAPYVEADQDLRVVLHAARGSAQAEQSVPVRITKARSLDDVLAAARRTHSGPIALVAQTVAPGEQIEVGIVQYQPGMRVALIDPQGLEVAASAVVDDQNEVMLTAPTIVGPARYSVTATYKNGESEETVIRNVTIGGAAVAPQPTDAAEPTSQ